MLYRNLDFSLSFHVVIFVHLLFQLIKFIVNFRFFLYYVAVEVIRCSYSSIMFLSSPRSHGPLPHLQEQLKYFPSFLPFGAKLVLMVSLLTDDKKRETLGTRFSQSYYREL